MTGAVCLHPGGLELTDRLLAASGVQAGAGVLDVGCGAGATVAHLADDLGLRVTGLDVSRERIEQAAEARPDLDFVAGRAEALPFAAASFDAVLCECVLSTVADAGAVLAEMARVLRPHGAALVSDVYARGADEPASASASPALGRRAAIERLFAGAGLAIVLWEDQPAALGRYLWDLAGSCLPRPAPPPAERRARPTGRRLGYFMCLARPTGATKGAPRA